MTDGRILFLDVDGPVNLDKPTASIMRKHSPIDFKEVLGFPIYFRRFVIDRINALSRAGVTVLWLTTWGDHARTDLGPALGFDDFAVAPKVGGSERTFVTNWWKLESIRSVVAARSADDRFVFLDDLARPTKRSLLDEFGDIARVYIPDPKVGVSETQLTLTERFLLDPPPALRRVPAEDV